MAEKFARWVIQWRYLVIIITLLLVGLATSGARFLSFTTDYRVFFSEDNPQLNAFESLQNTYTKTDNVMFVLEPDDGQVFTLKTLAAIEWLTNEAWQVPYSIRVDSISNFQYTYAEEDDLIVEDLVYEADNLTDENIENIKKIALSEPALINHLISPKAHVTAINVTIQLPQENSGKKVPEVVNFARELKQKAIERYPHLTIRLVGVVVMNNAFPEATRGDLQTLIPMMFIAIIVLLGVLLRGFFGAFATLCVLLLTIASTMGIAGWLGIVLSPPPAIAPVVLLTVAIADCVHILVSMGYEMRQGKDKVSALVASLRLNFNPVFLTSLTTAIGFLSMNTGEVPPFHDLGNIVAIGVVIAFVLSITFLPAFISILPFRSSSSTSEKHPLMDKFVESIIHYRRSLMFGMMATVLVLSVFIPQNQLNDILQNYFDHTFEIRRANDFTIENLTGLTAIHYALDSGKPNGINDPEFLNIVENFAQWLRQQPEVIHVSSITDTFKRLSKNMHGDQPDYYRLPETQELAAQYLLLYEMSLPFGLDLNNQINVDKSATRLAVSAFTLSNNELIAFEERAQQWLQENAWPSMQAPGAGSAVMFSHIGQRNIQAMLFGALIALVLISFILIFALRSLKYGLISLIPNLIPAAMSFGVWGLLVGEIGLGLSMVAGMTLGIIVDDTIHFLSKYLHAHRDEGMSATDAVRYTFKHVGMAMWFSTVILVVGFLILSLSHFQINSDMGMATALTIALALVSDFLLLPPLLIWLKDK